jgi:hypothetical protein
MKSIHSFQEEIMLGRPDVNHRFKAGAIGALLMAVTLLTICFGSSTANAQVLYGTLVGNVTDATGAAVVGATVVATNTGTGIAKTVVSDQAGVYRVSNLEPGAYKVLITSKSFATTVGEGIVILPNNERRFDVTLQPQSVGQTVQVTAAPAELQTDSAVPTNDLETAQVQTLVTSAGINMRNFQSLFEVLPGFSPPSEQHSESGNPADTMMFNANGVSGSNNSTRIDGVSDIYAWLPEITAYTPSTEAIASVNVVTNSFNAEQGFASGAAVSVTTKSGTNKFHGSAWEYNMISALQAKSPFFAATTLNKGEIPKYVLNQFGANYGGPIKKNKAFFFGNWERTRRAQQVAGYQTVPTLAMLKGDFSAFTTPIYDPSTGNSSGVGRKQFANNTIPSSYFTPAANQAAAEMISLLQANNNADLPNLAGGAGITATNISNDFYGGANAEYTRDNVDTRADISPSSKSTLFGRYGFQKTNIFDPQTLGVAGGTTFDGGQPGNAPSLIQSIGLGGTYAFKSNLLLDANGGYLRQGMSAKNSDIGTDWGTSQFGIPGTNTCPLCGGMPGFFFSGPSNLGNQNRSNPFQFRDNTYVSAVNLTWIKGKHSTRYGMEYDRFDINHFQPQNTYGPRGGFDFTGGLTACNTNCTLASGATVTTGASANALNAWAQFLLGVPTMVQKDTQTASPGTSRERVWAFYAQDQWQATEKLTVNFGVRYEYYPISTRDHTGLAIFHPEDGNIYLGGVGGNPENAGVSVGKGMIVPRFGLAYRIDHKTVARAGYGLSVNPDSFRNVLTTFPNIVSQTYQTSAYWCAFNGSTSTSYGCDTMNGDGIPAFTQAPLTTLLTSGKVAANTLGTPGHLGTISLITLPLNYRRGYYESYNAALERELPYATTLNVTYVGEFIVREVPGININANQAPGQTAAQEPYNALYGISASITSENPQGTGHYNALQAQAKHRFAGDSSVGVNYTYSRAINDYGDQSDGESSMLVPMTSQPYWHRNKSVAGFDRTHNLQAFGNYMFPFGKGQAYLQSGPAGYILGGWELDGALSRESGMPFTLAASTASLGPSATSSTQFAQYVGGQKIIGQYGAGKQYVSNIAYVDPKTITGWTPGFGNAGRNPLRGPGFTNLSLSMARTIRFTDRYNLVFRADAFNVTNTPQYNPPSNSSSSTSLAYQTSYAASGFGQITSVVTNSNRELRFSGRINF